MTTQLSSISEALKRFFKENSFLSAILAVGGALYWAGYWTADIKSSIKENEISQKHNEEISVLKIQNDERLRSLQIENDELRHKYQLLEIQYKSEQLEHK